MSTERDRAILKAYQAGRATGDVADDFGLSKGSVLRVLKREGCTLRRGYPSWRETAKHALGNPAAHAAAQRWGAGDRIAAYAEAYRQGRTPTDIAREYGVSRQAVSAALNRAGVKRISG